MTVIESCSKAAEISGAPYDADYYLHGRDSGKSLYHDYRWLPELTIPMCHWIVQHLGIQRTETVLDFGCARGYVVKALRLMGYSAFGIDISRWAIENADDFAAPCLSVASVPDEPYDWILAKDVLEHIPEPDLSHTINHLMRCARKGVFVVVPLSPAPGAEYVVPEYERDVTHVQRLDLKTWRDRLQRPGFCVKGVYRVPGIKDNYAAHERGNGFVLCRREEECGCLA